VAEREQLVFEAVTNQASTEIRNLSSQYRAATSGMSDDALKLASAQYRLDKALSTHGAGSNAARSAELNLRRAIRETTEASEKQERQFRETAAASNRLGGGFGSLRSRTLATAGAFLGGAGLVYGIRSVLTAAKESELVLGQTQVALEAVGLSWSKYGDRIEAAIAKQSRLGFDDEALLRTFSTFVRGNRDVEKSLRLNALAADVSRGRYISLEQAAQLVVKASLGQAGALRRLGIDAEKGATAQQLLTLLTEKYAGAAEKAAGTTTAAQERLNVAWENAKEIVGGSLTPVVTELADRVSDYLGDQRNMDRLQRQVNDAVETGTAVVRGLADGLGFVRDAAAPVVDALGGVENAAQLALIVGIATKVRKAAGTFGLIAAASSLTTRKVVADAAVAGAALDAAYRPRGAPVGAIPGAPAGRGRWVVPVGAGPVTVAVAAGLIAYTAASGSPSQAARGFGEPVAKTTDGRLVYRRDGQLYVAGAGPGAYGKPITVRGGSGRPITLYRYSPPATPGEGRPTPSPTSAAAGGGAGGGGSTARRTDQDFRLELAAALRTPGDADELRILRRRDTYLERQIEKLEANTNKTKAQRARLERLYAEEASVQGQINAIVSSREAARNTTAEAAARKRKEANERAAKLLAEQQDSALAGAGLAQYGWGAASTLAKGDTPIPTGDELSFNLEAPRDLRIKQLQAQLTEGTDDDLRAAKAIESYWTRRLRMVKKSSAIYEDILSQLVSAHDAVKSLEQQLSGSGPGSASAVAQQFQSELLRIVGAYAPNFGQYQMGGGGGFSSTQAYEATNHLGTQTDLLKRIAGKGAAVDVGYDRDVAAF